MSGSLSNLGDTYTRLSVSLEDHGGLFKVTENVFFYFDRLKLIFSYIFVPT